ncbi:unnamed protein product [Blepharisma stoltei]|uniref:Macro domain-containing protein n=1 Tax=Blepharisma stoltei TaxID=1481888 RepID=A0AAU9JVN9_9CILI|nr:unnamed protein product [Blepharisma stoltei]
MWRSHSASEVVRIFRNITIRVIQDDITAEKSDAIVNAANNHLMHGGGVAGAISDRGGPMVQKESTQWVREHGAVPTGQVAVTGPGRLHCKYIIHAVGPIYHNGRSHESELLEEAVMSSLEKAHELGLQSISIPAISSGIFGFPKPLCAKIMARCTKNFIESHPETTIKEIRLTNYDTPTVTLMEKEVVALYDGLAEEEKEEPKEESNEESKEESKEENKNEETPEESDPKGVRQSSEDVSAAEKDVTVAHDKMSNEAEKEPKGESTSSENAMEIELNKENDKESSQ